MEDEQLPENAARVGSYCLAKLQNEFTDYDFVGDIRGKGLMMAIELVTDKSSRESFMPGDPFLELLQDLTRQGGIADQEPGLEPDHFTTTCLQ